MKPTAPEEKELSDFAALVEEIAEGLDESARNDRNNGFPEAADETEDMADALRRYHARAQRIEAALRQLNSASGHVLSQLHEDDDGEWHNALHHLELAKERARAALES